MKFQIWFTDIINYIDDLYSKLESSSDIEILHQYRVQLRHLYAFSEIYLKQVDKKRSKKFSLHIKSVIKPTSTLRDLDVFLHKLDSMGFADELKNKLRSIVTKKREKVFKRLLEDLKSKKYKKCFRSFKSFIKKDTLFINDVVNADTYSIIKNLEDTLHVELNAVTLKTTNDELHKLRMKFKQFHYGLMLYENYFKKEKSPCTTLTELKKLQDCFGDIQDNHVRLKFIKSIKKELNKKEIELSTLHFKKNIIEAKTNLLLLREKFNTNISNCRKPL